MTGRLKPLVVGISGVTNGGKTTLCLKLQKEFQTKHIFMQDNYFFPVDSSHHVPCPSIPGHHNWELISSIDMDTMVADVKCAIADLTSLNDYPSKRPLILIDGFLLFDDPRMFSFCDLKFFVTLSKDLCWQRRSIRHYDPPDPPGYFEACVWPMYKEHLERIQSLSDISFTNGVKGSKHILDNTKNMIENLLNK